MTVLRDSSARLAFSSRSLLATTADDEEESFLVWEKDLRLDLAWWCMDLMDLCEVDEDGLALRNIIAGDHKLAAAPSPNPPAKPIAKAHQISGIDLTWTTGIDPSSKATRSVVSLSLDPPLKCSTSRR
ncbi:hypothetical protein RJ639_037448 [Escallonia herrerae]|uniref:Uncharacterized protein n=1 Tax=Escallonia herrerae TaxID=1293975 RepID=A0AA88WSF4_9ASTE|nr:hypothetical protein RJ639_037448 [Escallonia herrerae]